jgi:flagellar hook-basal body complex protein FliE
MTAINPGALGAYNAAAQLGGTGMGSALNTVADNDKTGPSFGDILKSATQSTIDAQKTSEKASADAVLGKADLTDVVSAVNNAEVSLNMFLAVRDKMIDAYNQIQRTQI